jgi:hypothetical protein
LDLVSPSSAEALLFVAGGFTLSTVILLTGAALSLLFGVMRHALDDFPRQKLLNDLPSDAERQRFEKMFETLERTRLATVLCRLAAEVAFIVALTDWWWHFEVFDLPQQSLLHLLVLPHPAPGLLAAPSGRGRDAAGAADHAPPGLAALAAT